MKYCIRCLTFKQETEFNWASRTKNILQTLCIICQKLNYQEKSSKLTPEERERRNLVQRQRVDAIMEKIVLYLLDHPCVDCGEDDIRVLDFDHLMDKHFNIGDLAHHKKNWEIISQEIIKCEVRCSNCHRKITHERLNSRKQRLFDKYRNSMLRLNNNNGA